MLALINSFLESLSHWKSSQIMSASLTALLDITTCIIANGKVVSVRSGALTHDIRCWSTVEHTPRRNLIFAHSEVAKKLFRERKISKFIIDLIQTSGLTGENSTIIKGSRWKMKEHKIYFFSYRFADAHFKAALKLTVTLVIALSTVERTRITSLICVRWRAVSNDTLIPLHWGNMLRHSSTTISAQFKLSISSAKVTNPWMTT